MESRTEQPPTWAEPSEYQHQEEGESFRQDVIDGRHNFARIFGDDRERIARGLGWFSIGLGLAEIMAPRTLARFLGVRNRGILFRMMGLREIAIGIGILTQRRTSNWLWARVGGDIIDLSLLGSAFNAQRAKPVNIAIASAAVAGVTALDVSCARELSRDGRENMDGTVKVKKMILVNRSAEELYRHWRNFQNLPRFMNSLESVEITGDKRSRWTARGPAGAKIKWDAEITEDRTNECIAWRSVDGDIDNFGSVRFEPAAGGRGTLVKVEMHYGPTAGVVGISIAKLFGRAPEQEVAEALRHFKQVMEAGEIITTIGQPAGRGGSTSWKYDRAIRRVSSDI